MLRAEELIIGDWVQVTHNGKPRYVQVTFIGLPDDIGYDIKDEVIVKSGKAYSPIPLTAEILENYGFKDIDSDPDGCDGYDIYYRSGDGWGINVNDFKLHYVHELQHFLRLCGLNELAENFKVE